MQDKQKPSRARVESIDYFRGLVALSVMAYHMHLFTFGDLDSETLLGKFNTYRVSFFYILSGITLYLVYSSRLELNKFSMSNFYMRRFFRLVPLLWLANILTVIFQFSPEMLSIKKIIANVTVLPGAFKPETFIASGAWSIGDELFFYLFFPWIVFLARINNIYLFICLFLSALLLYYFAFYILNPEITLGEQWSNYVNPLGQIFFFVMGITLGYISKYVSAHNLIYLLLFAVIFYLFATHPVSGNSIILITGQNRIILTFYTIILCFLFFKFDFSFLPDFLKSSLQFFGNVSYSLYLLHPIVYFLVKDFLNILHISSSNLLIASTVILSILVSHFSYEYFEKYYITAGKKYYAKLESKMKGSRVINAN